MNLKNLIIFILFLQLTTYDLRLFSQPKYSDINRTRVVFYNTENLFDTFHDSLKQDMEFTPDALRHWNFKRYYKKLNNIAKVIIAAGEWDAPGIIGLCEIENNMVLTELIHKTPLKAYEYSYVHFDSPDERGLGVALLYRREIMKLLFSKPFHVIFPSDTSHTTRDILYAKGLIFNKDTVHLFVNHWPSRREGQENSEKRRIFAAQVLLKCIDSIQNIYKHANIIIMGDFNDEPTDKSIKEILRTKGDTININDLDLFNVMFKKKMKNEWTYFYKYNFITQKYLFDQFIISPNLIKTHKQGVEITLGETNIFKPEWILTSDNDGNKKPFSTYTGPHYNGGFSDHLPIFIDLIFREN